MLGNSGNSNSVEPREGDKMKIKERQDKHWEPNHKKAMAQASRKINEFEARQNNSNSNTSSTKSEGKRL